MLLRLKDIVVNSLKMLAENTLGACKHDDCMYEYPDGSRCTAGAGMTEEMIDYIKSTSQNTSNVNMLGKIELDFSDRIVALQMAHDEWARSKSVTSFGYSPEKAEKKKGEYLTMLMEQLVELPELYETDEERDGREEDRIEEELAELQSV
jgi:hypothetical protein